MTAQTADQLYDEFRQASLDWLAVIGPYGLDEKNTEQAQRFERADERVSRIGEAIKSLPAGAPGALRVKSALALFWYDSPDELEDDVTSEDWLVAARADFTLAAARVMCPDYFEALYAARSA